MGLKNNLEKVSYYLKRYGVVATTKKVLKRAFHIKEDRKTNQEQYMIWLENNKLTEEMLEEQRKTKFKHEPTISVVVPMYNTEKVFFKELIESLKNQTYSKWELCLADGSEVPNELLKDYIDDDRIKYSFLNSNLGISENTNKAIEMATGDFIGFLDHDDLLSQDALYEVVKAINEEKNVDFIYTDEDKIDENKERFEPYFKPDFSPETLECNNYITHFVVVKKALLKEVGMLNSKFNGAQDFDFVLRVTEKAENIVHIPKVLYHWRVHRGSTANVADAKPYAFEAGIKVVEEHLKRMNKAGDVQNGQDIPGIYRINYKVIGNPKVSILIPNRDNVKLLKEAVSSILELTSYSNYEIVIIENGSTDKETFKYYDLIKDKTNVKILKFDEDTDEFNYSKLINLGVKNVDGEFVLQLNNDIKIISKDWLDIMVGYSQQKEIGAVGGRLYYEDKTIQHAGIIVGLSGIAGNMLVNLPYGERAYFGRESATRNVAAVTGACLLCRRELYEEVGYMDEELFKVAFNDVDFCLKLMEKGYRNVYVPYVELYHYESKTRGYEYSKEKEERFNRESDNFKSKWKEILEKGDPYYNINFTRETCNYDIRAN